METPTEIPMEILRETRKKSYKFKGGSYGVVKILKVRAVRVRDGVVSFDLHRPTFVDQPPALIADIVKQISVKDIGNKRENGSRFSSEVPAEIR